MDAEARREQRALRRAERAEVEEQERREMVRDITAFTLALVCTYIFMFFGAAIC